MIILPAIDILDKKAVRLYKGDYDQVTVYGTPLEIAKSFEKAGTTWLHLVDLNGAKGDEGNLSVIQEIIENTALSIEVGGGIRSLEKAKAYLDMGVNQVIIGTAAVKDPQFLKALVKSYPNQVTVGVDAKNGFVAVDGWLEATSLEAKDFICHLEKLGIKRIVYTDISKDGTLTGPNFEMYKKILNSTTVEIIASGGISCKEDVIKLKAIGVPGVVVGKALYEKKFTLEEVL